MNDNNDQQVAMNEFNKHAEFAAIMNEFKKIHDEIEALNERFNKLESGKFVATKSRMSTIVDKCPSDEYLDKLEVEELKKAKEELYNVTNKFNCTIPNC